MKYLDFVKSTRENRLHAVSKITNAIHLDVAEPCYVFKTSGSTKSKFYIHSLSSIEASVGSFLKVFDLDKSDCWGLCLSANHVAGFSVLARSYFAGLRSPFVFEWSVEQIEKNITENQISILSLVPTQVFDLVRTGVESPKSVKYVFVGGALLSQNLLESAKDLGWPIVTCYGSTETFAQMAHSDGRSFFKPFPGWNCDSNDKGELLLSGPSLYDFSVEEGEVHKNTKKWFNTQDLVKFKGDGFSVLGKSNGLIKIKGSYFDFNQFKAEFKRKMTELNISEKNCFPVVLKEERNNAGVYLVGCDLPLQKADLLLQAFAQVRGIFQITEGVFSEIGKVEALKLEGVLSKPVVSL